MSADDVLGRTYVARLSDGYTVQYAEVQAVGWDPQRGVRLVGRGTTPAWVDFDTWTRLHDAGVLVES